MSNWLLFITFIKISEYSTINALINAQTSVKAFQILWNTWKHFGKNKTLESWCYVRWFFWERSSGVTQPLILWEIKFLCFLHLYLFFHCRLTWSFFWSLFWLIQISVCISRVFIATHFPHQVILGVIGGKYDPLLLVVSFESFSVICFMFSDSS